MTKFFQKIKKTYFGANLYPFSPSLGKNEFFWKKKDSVKYSNYLPSGQKSEKTNEPFLRKMLNWQMDRQADGQTMVIL